MWLDYLQDGPVRESIQKILCLGYLPAHDIDAALEFIQSEAPDSLEPLFDYIRSTWSGEGRWTPACWSVFNLQVRTNNDAEGLHNLWNRNGRSSKPPFYQVTDFLYPEAEKIALQEKLVHHGKLTRENRKATKEKDELLTTKWAEYKEKIIDAIGLVDYFAKELHFNYSYIANDNSVSDLHL